MKKTFIFWMILALALSSFTNNNDIPSFDFIIKKTENNITEARFKLTNEINMLSLKKEILEIKGVQSFFLLNLEDNYFRLNYSNNTELNQIRKVFLTHNTDFDKEFIIVTNKSFYNN